MQLKCVHNADHPTAAGFSIVSTPAELAETGMFDLGVKETGHPVAQWITQQAEPGAKVGWLCAWGGLRGSGCAAAWFKAAGSAVAACSRPRQQQPGGVTTSSCRRLRQQAAPDTPGNQHRPQISPPRCTCASGAPLGCTPPAWSLAAPHSSSRAASVRGVARCPGALTVAARASLFWLGKGRLRAYTDTQPHTCRRHPARVDAVGAGAALGGRGGAAAGGRQQRQRRSGCAGRLTPAARDPAVLQSGA